MGSRRYRAPKDDNTLDYFYKDIEGEGTKENPDKTGVVIRPNNLTGDVTDVANKDGNFIEVLKYIANTQFQLNNNSTANKDGDLLGVLRYISNNLAVSNNQSAPNKDGDLLGVLRYIANNLVTTTNNSIPNKDGDVLAILRYISNNLALNNSNSTANKDGDLLGTLRYISNNLTLISSQNRSSKVTTVTNRTVSTTLTTIFDTVCANHNQLSLRLQNTGSVALNALQVHGFESEDFPNDFQIIADTGASYTSQNGRQTNNNIIPVVDASGTFPGVPGNQGKAGILLNVRFYQRIRLQASVSAGTTTMSVGGTLMC
jgi:hypothetical protein